MKYKIFSTKGMVHIPAKKEYFRVGPYIGECVFKFKGVVIMKKC